MYYDDQYDNSYNDESLDDYVSPKEVVKAVKRLDKNYDQYSIDFNNVWTDGKYHKTITIENYGSGSHGTLIRNAVTGVRYNIKVGSKEEDLFFKVSDTTRHRKDPLLLYYDTPEQYENHRLTKVSQPIKAKWVKKSLKAQKRN